MYKTLLLVAVLACIMPGCKKSKPQLSFRNETNMLVGDWSLSQISSSGTGVNGIPGTPTSAGSTTEFYKPTVLKLNVDQTASLEGYMLRRDVDTTTKQVVSGSWKLEKNQLTLYWDGNDVYNPEIQEYTLETLSKKKLGIKYQRVNSSGGMTSDFSFVYTFEKQ